MATLTANPWVRLGRVSNLPTVWSNSLAAAVLSGVQPTWLEVTASALILSTFYVSGMILNDAFDVEYDAVHRPARPIPAGQVSRSAAFGAGFGGLCVGLLAMVAVAAPAARWGAGVWGMALATCIVVYDRHHKQNPFSPVLMGACRAVAIGAVCWIHAGQLTSGVVVAALLQWSYVV